MTGCVTLKNSITGNKSIAMMIKNISSASKNSLMLKASSHAAIQLHKMSSKNFNSAMKNCVMRIKSFIS